MFVLSCSKKYLFSVKKKQKVIIFYRKTLARRSKFDEMFRKNIYFE